MVRSLCACGFKGFPHLRHDAYVVSLFGREKKNVSGPQVSLRLNYSGRGRGVLGSRRGACRACARRVRDEYFQEIQNFTLQDYNTPLQVLHYKIEEALRAPILHSGLCNTRMFARAMGLATRASLIQYYWVECRCSAPAFSPSTEERAPSTRWKEAFSLNDAFSSACLHAAPRVKPAALL